MQESAFVNSGLPAVAVRLAGATDAGRRRSENQDNFLISDLSADEDVVTLRPGAAGGEAEIQVGERGALLLVADGMGGAAAGRLASGLACTFVLAELQEGWLQDGEEAPRHFGTRLHEAVNMANRRIWQHAQRHADTLGMGSTITAAGVLGDMLFLAQVGDSRAYLVRAGTTTQLTRDQSLVQHMVDAGALSPEDAERSSQGNIILQALGVKPTVEVDMTSQQVRRDDHLILCSDGLHRVVRPEEFATTIARLRSPRMICDEFVRLALERGAPDNVTVVYAHFGGPGLAEARSTDAVTRSPWRHADPA